MEKSRKILIVIVAVLAVVLVAISCFNLYQSNTEEESTDASKFSSEYTNVSSNNVFVYRDIDEIIKILENGSGIVYLGFPECPWCQKYVTYLNEVALDMGVSKIYYYNIKEDRANNTENYQKIVEMLSDYLQYDDEGNKRIYVPCVIGVKKGEIVGYDDETAWDTKGYDDPSDYWTDEEVEDLKLKLETIISDTDSNICSDCN